MSTPVPASRPTVPPDADRAASEFIGVAGGFVAVVAAAVTALAEIMLAPLRVGGVLIGASVLVAVAVNLMLVWFTHYVTGSRWALLLPALAWFAVMLTAAGRTTEGDFLLVTNWVGAAMVIAGSVAFGLGAYRLIVPPRTARRAVLSGPGGPPPRA